MKLYLLGILALCALMCPAKAHRLDECLVATRVDVRTKGIDFEIILIPGVELLPTFLAWIDKNGDGILSQPEGDRFAKTLLAECSLAVNESKHTLTLSKVILPDEEKLKRGLGKLRIHARVDVSHSIGEHKLNYHCTHQPKQSVYLVNALSPEEKGITIGRQKRDLFQKDYQLKYTVAK